MVQCNSCDYFSDPTVLEYKKHAPVTDSEQFKKYLLNAIPEDGIAFQDQNTLPSFYRVCFCDRT